MHERAHIYQMLHESKIYVENSHSFKSAVYSDRINFCFKHEIFHQPESKSIHMYMKMQKRREDLFYSNIIESEIIL